jgi:hypothetical protein
MELLDPVRDQSEDASEQAHNLENTNIPATETAGHEDCGLQLVPSKANAVCTEVVTEGNGLLKAISTLPSTIDFDAVWDTIAFLDWMFRCFWQCGATDRFTMSFRPLEQMKSNSMSLVFRVLRAPLQRSESERYP